MYFLHLVVSHHLIGRNQNQSEKCLNPVQWLVPLVAMLLGTLWERRNGFCACGWPLTVRESGKRPWEHRIEIWGSGFHIEMQDSDLRVQKNFESAETECESAAEVCQARKKRTRKYRNVHCEHKTASRAWANDFLSLIILAQITRHISMVLVSELTLAVSFKQKHQFV